MRVDKWLWVARFFRSRTLARTAIELGRVQVNGHRVGQAKQLTEGAVVSVRQGHDEKVVIVKGFMDKRSSAVNAQTLYEETPCSIQQRQLNAQLRRDLSGNRSPESKPDKKSRREIVDLKRQ